MEKYAKNALHKTGPIKKQLGVGLVDPYSQLKECDFKDVVNLLEELLIMPRSVGFEETRMFMGKHAKS